MKKRKSNTQTSRTTQNGLSSKEVRSFRSTIYTHYHTHGRHELPWRKNMTPYRILVSELMLQQTQVDRVIPKFNAFVKAFPSFRALAKAPTKQVLSLWQGLGYNRRALGLQQCAQKVVAEHKGKLPDTYEELVTLPYIGPATASALCMFAFEKPAVYIETNVRAIYIHHFFPRKKKVSDTELLPLIEQTFDTKHPRAWGSALLDYGSHLKKQMPNPSRRSKHHTIQSRFEGSNRQIRGAILRTLLANTECTLSALCADIKKDKPAVLKNLETMEKEGLVRKQGRRYSVV